MARYNEILAGRYNKLLSKAFSMKGPSPTPQLSGEITPTISFVCGKENRILESWQTFGIAMNAPAGGAGNISVIRLRNPPNSKVIAVMEKITVLTGAADNVVGAMTYPDTGDLTTPTRGQGYDSRGVVNSSVIASSKNNTATSVATSASMRVGIPSPNQSVDIIVTDIQEIPMAPGSMYELAAILANEQLIVSFMWRERPMEDAETTQ